MGQAPVAHKNPLVLCETGTCLAIPLHVSLNISYFSKVITWATCVRFRRIIYRFDAYDEMKQIQNYILHFIYINVLHIHFTRFCSVKSYLFCFFRFNGFRCTSIMLRRLVGDVSRWPYGVRECEEYIIFSSKRLYV